MTTPQHDDPFGEGTGKVLQALAVLTTIGESAARFVASGAQNRAAAAERQAGAERVADSVRQQADRTAARAHAAQVRADRQVMDKAFDRDWLAKADIFDTATLWRTAAMYSMSGDKRATEARNRAQERLRDLNPGLMDAFARHRAGGMNLAEAMKAAAHDVWRHQTRANAKPSARPHGNAGDPAQAIGPPLLAVGAGPDPNGAPMADELDAATRAEVARLADGVDVELLDGLKRQWRGTGGASAADAAGCLAEAARQLRAASQLDDGQVTDPAAARRAGHGAQDPTQPVAGTRANNRNVPTQNMLASAEPVAQGQDGTTPDVRAGQAAEHHLAGFADGQHRIGALDRGVPDIASTQVNEHQDAMASSRLHHSSGDHDRAGANQQQRLGRAFPPLGTVTPRFSAAPATTHPAPTQRKGRVR